MTPEQLIAARLFKDYQLKVPVDVEGLARSLADLEEDILPSGVDAVLVNDPQIRSRPLIVLDSRQVWRRKRFTLAHELGHLLISWHLGVIGCHPNAFGGWGEVVYAETEVEANRFASELLLPSEWLKSIIAGGGTIEEVFKKVTFADASDAASSLALVQAMPPGHVFAQVDIAENILLSAASPGTAAPPPSRGTKLSRRLYENVAVDHSVIQRPQSTFHWWEFAAEVPLAFEAAEEGASAILNRIVARHLPADEASGAKQSIAGVVGYANSKFKAQAQTAGQLVSVLQQRFMTRPELKWLVKDAEFSRFLAVKAQEIASRKGQK